MASPPSNSAPRESPAAASPRRDLCTISRSGWKTNYPIGGYKVDVAFPRQKVTIEVDGWAFHSDHDDFVHDRKRQNAIALIGWQVPRFTWLDLTEYPQRVIAEIRFALSQRS
ncbi:MAG TPA: DUF559 domain-containing protein, partial [Mycobacterium sp.]|nr:DUF559 domain-containing protein [Mycobacterium sp.]